MMLSCTLREYIRFLPLNDFLILLVALMVYLVSVKEFNAVKLGTSTNRVSLNTAVAGTRDEAIVAAEEYRQR